MGCTTSQWLGHRWQAMVRPLVEIMGQIGAEQLGERHHGTNPKSGCDREKFPAYSCVFVCITNPVFVHSFAFCVFFLNVQPLGKCNLARAGESTDSSSEKAPLLLICACFLIFKPIGQRKVSKPSDSGLEL